jgi:hypothetical protein
MGGITAAICGIVWPWESEMPNPQYEQAKRSVEALGPADQLRLIAETRCPAERRT